MKFLVIQAFILAFCIESFGSTNVEEDNSPGKKLIKQAENLLDQGNYDSSYLAYEAARDFYIDKKDSIGIGESLYGMGVALHFQGKSKDALPLYLESISLLENRLPENHSYFSKLNNNIGAAYIDQGERFIAKRYIAKGHQIDLEKDGKDSLSTAISSYNLGLISMYFGEHQESLSHFMNALPTYLRKYGTNGSRVAQLYTNVGINHFELCDYDLAKEYYQRAVDIHLENHGENYWNLAYPYTTLGELYDLQNQDSLALAYFQKALILTETSERDLSRLKSIINGILGKFYNKKGEYEKALFHTDLAIDIIQKSYFEDHPRTSDFYRIKGNIYKNLGQFKEAKESYEKAIEIIEINYGTTHPILAKNYADMADMYIQSNDFEEAHRTIEYGIRSITLQLVQEEAEAISEINSVMDEKELLSLIIERGNVHRKQAHENPNDNIEYRKRALEDYSFATEIIDHLRRELLAEGSKLAMQQKASFVYENAIEICNELFELTGEKTYLKRAFYFFEKNKGAVLSEAIQAANISEIQGIPDEVLISEKEINRHVKSLELKLADSEKSEDDSLQKALSRQLFHAKLSQDSLARIIKREYSEYYDLKYNDEIITLDQVQQNLKKNTLVISIFEGDSSWYLFSISPVDFRLNKIQKSRLTGIDLNKLFHDLSNGSSNIADLSKLSFHTYQAFFHPILKDNSSSTRLIVIPDGQFCYIPLGALVVSDPEKKGPSERSDYLIEKFSISYANSLTINSQKVNFNRNETYIGFAPSYTNPSSANGQDLAFRDIISDLAGTQEEVKQAGKLFDGSVFLASDATESMFKSLQLSTTIIHLAMHAIVDDQNPLQSRLLFSQEADTVEDGELNAYEIYGKTINGQLAVLSACNTGVGEIKRGEGVMSLSRAFIYAGCPNIVMSLWRAKDQPTKKIITEFFSSLKKELPMDDALRAAKLDYLDHADPLQAHPANWSTFVLLGNSEPLSFGTKTTWYWIAAILICMLAAFILYQKNQRAGK